MWVRNPDHRALRTVSVCPAGELTGSNAEESDSRAIAASTRSKAETSPADRSNIPRASPLHRLGPPDSWLALHIAVSSVVRGLSTGGVPALTVVSVRIGAKYFQSSNALRRVGLFSGRVQPRRNANSIDQEKVGVQANSPNVGRRGIKGSRASYMTFGVHVISLCGRLPTRDVRTQMCAYALTTRRAYARM